MFANSVVYLYLCIATFYALHCVKCKGMYKRSEFHLIKERLEEPRRFIQVVMGPRQIGKSTVVKQVLNELKLLFQFYSADNVPATDRAWISNCWAAARARMESNQEKTIILVIDEIQKIKNWSEVVKSFES